MPQSFIRPIVVEGDRIAYESHDGVVAPATSAGVELLLPGKAWAPLRFAAVQKRGKTLAAMPLSIEGLTLRWTLTQRTPTLIERTLEVTAERAVRFTVAFPLSVALPGEWASFSGPTTEKLLCDTIRGAARTETFPVGMLRTSTQVYGLAADAPGLWENRCQVLLDPQKRQLSVLTGDGRALYPLVIRPPEDARDTYQYEMDGWQSLEAGETRRFTTWVFVSPARNHYEAQLAAHLAVANAKGWNHSAVEAILRNTSLYLLRRNLARDAANQPRAGRYIFVSGPGYGWKQWVSDGFWTALGLDDPEKTIESQKAVFWTRMDYEDNCHYYLIWAVLMQRAGGNVDKALVQRAYDFIRRHEKDGLYIPPPLPGSPNPRGWKTYHDVLLYDDDDCPTSDQGFHCAALMAAKELGLPVTEAEMNKAIVGYGALFNSDLGFFPTSRKQRETLGQDTLYGATLAYAVFGKKLLPDALVKAHFTYSERVKTPYGLRVISKADGSLLDGHSGVYCYGGSWFLNDAANYLLAEVHGVPAAQIEALLAERILRELAQVPGFNESISTLDGHPHGHVLYSWNSGYFWLRKQVRRRLGRRGDDPIDRRVDEKLGVVRRNGALVLEREEKPITKSAPGPWIGYTELRCDLLGGRHANIRTMRARLVAVDGSSGRELGASLLDKPDSWTQFAGWSPDGRLAILGKGWQDPENARWEEEHKQFRMEPGKWAYESALVELATGKVTIPTAVERVGHYNSGLFFLPEGRGLGFTTLINGVSKPFLMDRDGRHKRALPASGAGFAYGYSASPDGKWVSFHEDYQVIVARADGSQRRTISTGNPFNFAPRWSPDSQWLLFVSGVRGKSDPYIVRPDGTGLRKIADLGGYQGWVLFLDVPDFHEGSSDLPAWAMDSKSVFHASKVGESVELFRTTLVGHSERLTQTPPGTLHYHPTPSPDGKWLAYGTRREGVRQLAILNLHTQKEHLLTKLKKGYAALWPHWQL